ncbi:hypothetical protein PV325_013239 [Microctonus aethiopoides]|nr:hypothetical protein PV325_013239 [Microctonus aethiopoides]
MRWVKLDNVAFTFRLPWQNEMKQQTRGGKGTVNDKRTSLFAVAAHEFGHSLGLAHSSVRGALMYPWYQGISQNYELPEDDRNGIQQMYGAPEDRLWARIPDRFSPPTTTTTRSPRTRPTKRPYGPTRPNTYPDEPGRPGNRPHDRYPYKPGYRTEQPERPVWTERPWKPHRHHPVVTTTTTTIAPSTSHRPRHRWTPPPRNDIPDKCDTSYDAITHIRREIFIFKGRYLWRVGEQGPYEGYPVEITRLFNLPENIDHVDAVYERLDRKIVVFIGRNYYVFNAHELEPGYPRSLKTLGLPETLEKIDAAMVWGHNSKTYFFSGTMFDESIKHVELDYPRDMSMFRGVDYNIDTVFQWKNGKTYFFKGKGFWEFNDMRMRVAHEKPKSSAQFWMGCPPEMETNDVDFPERRAKIINNAANTPTFRFSLIILLLIALSMRIT